LSPPSKNPHPYGWGFLLGGNKTQDENNLNGSVRWTLPATSANTGGYIYFRPFPGENASRVLLSPPEKSIDFVGAFFN